MFGFLLILFLGFYVYDKYIYEEWPVERVERITGINMPEFKIIKSNRGERSFNGDHMDSFTLEFEVVPSDEFFDEIDKMIEKGKTGWRREGITYKFSIIWGNGYPAPEGESEDADGTFGLTITKGEKKEFLESGSW